MSVLAEKVVHRRRLRLRGSLVVGLLLIGLFLLAAAAPGWIAPYDPLAFDMTAILKPPSALHPFGTDNFGRDYPVILGLTLALALLVSLVFLVTDLVQAALDPRVSA